MELKRYKKLSFQSIFIFLLFIILDGFYSYIGDVLGLHIFFLFVGMVIGIIPGIVLTKQLRKSLVGSNIVFSKEDKYKALFYGVVIGNIIMILMIVIVILTTESPLTFDNLLENLVKAGTKFTGIIMGAMFTILIIQYMWVNYYEKKQGQQK